LKRETSLIVFFTESRLCDGGVIKKIETLVLCNEKGMEVVLRMLILFMRGEIPLGTPRSSETVLYQIRDDIHHWIVGKLCMLTKTDRIT
jgi:hypothetical protein